MAKWEKGKWKSRLWSSGCMWRDAEFTPTMCVSLVSSHPARSGRDEKWSEVKWRPLNVRGQLSFCSYNNQHRNTETVIRVHFRHGARPCGDFDSHISQNLFRKVKWWRPDWQVKGSHVWCSKQVIRVLRVLGANKIFYMHSLNCVFFVLKQTNIF